MMAGSTSEPTMRNVTHIVIHCTATPQSAKVESIQKYWCEQLKWKAPGYHHILRPDGSIATLADDETVCNGVANRNARSIHISYIGGVDQWVKPVDNRTPAQCVAMLQLIQRYLKKYPSAIVCGHRDFPGVTKACPSFDVKAWLKSTLK